MVDSAFDDPQQSLANLRGYVKRKEPSLADVGGSTWRDRIKETSLYKMGADSLGALTLAKDVYDGRVDPLSDEGIGKAATLAGLVTLGAGAMPDDSTLRMGIKAYHGSPHDFDRFDMGKIGTGEGAQAYGNGLYFAENEGVAQSYRDALSTQSIKMDPVKLSNPQLSEATGFTPEAIYMAKQELENLKGDVGQTVDLLDNLYLNTGYERAKEAASVIRAMSPSHVKQKGHMYEVNINADPADFLDWDKPLSEQPQKVRDAVANIANLRGESGGYVWDSIVKAKNAEGAFGEHMSDPAPAIKTGPKAAMEHLREAGIPGIKYLDAGSRGTSGGELLSVVKDEKGFRAKIKKFGGGMIGAAPTDMITTSKAFASEKEAIDWANGQIAGGSRNYVVFDDSLIEIVRKYGLAALAPLLGGAALVSQTGTPLTAEEAQAIARGDLS